MTLSSVEPRPWARRRWWGLVGLVLGVQLALIFWLGETAPISPRPAAAGLTLRLAGRASAELLALRDPTLFVLPHDGGVPAPSWLKPPVSAPSFFVGPEPTNAPLLAVDQPGAAFNRFSATNLSLPLFPLARPQPQLSLPNLPPQPPAADRSALRVEGALARRRLLTPLDLRSWTNADILTNSVVQLLVDADGAPRSVTLLSGSGSGEADRYSLDQAWAARFAPLSRAPLHPTLDPAMNLGWGKMIFHWHTVPPPPTNAPPISP